MPGPVGQFSYSDDEVSAIKMVLESDGASPEAWRDLKNRLERSKFWFSSMLDHKAVLPEANLIDHLDRLKKTADRVVHQAELLLGAELNSDADDEGRDSGRRKTRHGRPSPKRFRERLARLAAFFPSDPDFVSGQVADTAFTEALRLTGDQGDKPLTELVHTLRIASEMDSVPPEIISDVGVDQGDPIAAAKSVVEAAGELARRAAHGSKMIKQVRELTIRSGHRGDAAVNGWIDDMLSLYETMTGKSVRTAVGKPGWNNEGVAYGPVIDFLRVASAPLDNHLADIALSKGHAHTSRSAGPGESLFPSDQNAWRSRIRTALKARSRPKALKADIPDPLRSST